MRTVKLSRICRPKDPNEGRRARESSSTPEPAHDRIKNYCNCVSLCQELHDGSAAATLTALPFRNDEAAQQGIMTDRQSKKDLFPSAPRYVRDAAGFSSRASVPHSLYCHLRNLCQRENIAHLNTITTSNEVYLRTATIQNKGPFQLRGKRPVLDKAWRGTIDKAFVPTR